MARLEFPDSPILNQVYTGDNGVTYTWNGTYWAANDGEALDDRYVQVVGDTMIGNLTVPSMNTGALAGLRNQIINGDTKIWQRGTSGGSIGAGGAYTADHVFMGSGVAAWTRAPSASFASGLEYGLRFSGDANCYAVFPVELLRAGHPNQFANGTQWTVSYYADRATDHTAGIYFSDTSQPTNKVDVLPTSTPTSLGGNRYAATFTVANAPVSTNTCLCARIANVTGSQIEITGVQLEPGPVATPFELRPVGTELALCQRYFQKYDRVRLFPGNTSNLLNRFLEIPRPVVMRAKPTESGTKGNDVNNLTYPHSTASTLGTQASVNTSDDGAIINNYTADAEL